MDPSLRTPAQGTPTNISSVRPQEKTTVNQEIKTYSLKSKIWDIFEYILLFLVIFFLVYSIQASVGFLLDRTPNFSLGSEMLDGSDLLNYLYIPFMPIMFIWFYLGQGILYLIPFLGSGLYPDFGGDGPVYLRRENIFFFFVVFSILYIHIKGRFRNNPQILKSRLRMLIGVVALIYSSLFMLEGFTGAFIASNQGLDISVVLTYLSSAVIYGFVAAFYIVELLEIKFKKLIYILSFMLIIFTLLLVNIGTNANKNSKNFDSTINTNSDQENFDPPGNLFSDSNSVRVLTVNKQFYSEKSKSNVILEEAYLSPTFDGINDSSGYDTNYLQIKYKAKNDDSNDVYDYFKVDLGNSNYYDAYSSGGDPYYPDDSTRTVTSLFTVDYPESEFNIVFLGSDKPESINLDFSKAQVIKGTLSDDGVVEE
jgi:hypothetical protein